MQAQPPSSPVGTQSGTLTATVTITTAGTLKTISVLTQGATGLDFQELAADAGTCKTKLTTAVAVNDTCTVQYTFTPTHPWSRYGGVVLADASGNVLGNLFLQGTGTGPQVNYPLSATSATTVLLSGSYYPQSVAVDGSGDVFFGNNFNDTIQEIVAVGGVIPASPTVKTLASGLGFPSGVAVDGSGNVYFSDQSAGTVSEIVAVGGQFPATPTIVTIASGFKSPQGLAVDGNGNVYLGDGGSANAVEEILAVNGVIPASPTINTLHSSTNAATVAVDPSGDVFVADDGGNGVYEIVAVGGSIPSNPTIKTLVTGQFDGVALDGLGNVYATKLPGTLEEILAVGGTIPASPTVVTLGSGFNSLYRVAVDASGNLFVGQLVPPSSGQIDELSVQSAPALAFASTIVGETSSDSPQTVTLGNNGTDPLVFSIPTAGGNPAVSTNFSLSPSSTCPILTSTSLATASLASGASCTEILSFAPTASGPLSGSSTATDNNLNATAATQAIALSGTGIAGVLTITPASPSVVVNTASVTLNANVGYNGVAPTGAVTFTVNGGTALTATCSGTSTPLACSVSYNSSALTVNTYPIVVNVASDANYSASSGNGTLTVTAGTTTVVLAPPSGTVNVDGSVTFTAAVTPNSGIVPSGSVSFSTTVNSVTSVIPGCSAKALSSSGGMLKATCTTTALTAGSNAVVATLAADANFTGATSNTATETVSQAGTTLAVTSAPTTSTVDQSVNLTATLSATAAFTTTPTGTVEFKAAGVDIQGCSAVTLGATPHTAVCTTSSLVAPSDVITAVYSGDTNFSTSTSPNYTQIVAKDTPSNTVLSSLTSSVVNENVTFTATIAPNGASANGVAPSGNVTFTKGVGGSNVCAPVVVNASADGTATAACTVAFTSSFAQTGIYAVYSGDQNLTVGNSPHVNQVVSAAPTTTTVTSQTNPATVNQSVTLTATITPTNTGASYPGTATPQSGSLYFVDSLDPTTHFCATTVTAGALSPSTCSHAFTSADNHVVTAVFTSTDANFQSSSTANGVTEVVSASGTTLTVSNAGSATLTVNQAATFAATFPTFSGGQAIPQGTVAYSDSLATTNPICTVTVNGTTGAIPNCTETLMVAGTHVITAVFSSTNSNFGTIDSQNFVQVVNQNTTTVALTSPTSTTSTVDQVLTFTATVTPSVLTPAATGTVAPTGAVTFAYVLGGTTTTICSPNVTTSGGGVTSATCSAALPSTGSYSITATYAGDTNFKTNASGTHTQVVSKTGTSLALVSGSTLSSPASPPVNLSAPYSVQLSLNGGISDTGLTVPTGNVVFTDTVTSVTCTAVLSTTGLASCSLAEPTAGSHTIGVAYNGDSNFSASTANFSETIALDATSVPTANISVAPASPAVNQSTSLSATVTAANPGTAIPSGTVTFSDASLGNATTTCVSTLTGTGAVPACTHIFTSAGSHTLTAAYSGDTNFQSSSSSITVSVGTAGGTSITLGTTTPTLTVDQQATFTGTFAGLTPGGSVPQGTVSYSDSLATVNPICANLAVSSTGTIPNCVETMAVAGTHVITAEFTSSNSNFGTIDSQNFAQVVAQNTTAVALTSPSGSTASVDQVLTFTATVTPSTLTPAAVGTTAPTGTVSFSYVLGGVTTPICTPNAVTSGGITSASCSAALPATGSYLITATYSGDSNFKTNASTGHTVVVGKTGTSLALISGSTLSNPSSPVVNQSAPYSVQLSLTGGISDTGLTVPTGSVMFTDATTSVSCSAVLSASGQASCSLAEPTAGSHTIVAVYSGDPNFNGATANFGETIAQDPTTVPSANIGVAPSNPAVDQSTSLTATVTPANTGTAIPSGTVTFSDAAAGITTTTCVSTLTSTGSVPACTHLFTSSGTHTLTANYSGDANFQGSSSSINVVVGTSGGTSITVATTTPTVIVNQQATFTATFSALPPGGAVPQGTVSYFDTLVGTSAISTCTSLAVTSTGTIPNCTETMLVAGQHNLSAVFTPAQGNTNFPAITSAPFPQTVGKNSYTIGINSTLPNSTVDQPVTFTSTITPATLTPAAVGTTSPTGTVEFVSVSGGVSTVLCLNSPISTTGGVTSATCALPASTVASTYQVTATYVGGGDANFTSTTTSATLTQIVGLTATSVVVVPPASQPAVNAQATYTAQVAPVGVTDTATGALAPTGTVVFTDSATGATCSGVVAASNGQASCSFAEPTAGNHTVVAAYSGDVNFDPSSTSIIQVIGVTTPSILLVSSAPTTVADYAVTYTATVTSTGSKAPTNATKPISFSVTQGTTSFSCPLVGETVTASQDTATCKVTFPASVSGANITVTATYYGDSNYSAVTSSPLTQTVQSFVPTVTPAQIVMAQGSATTANTNLTDAFSITPILLSSVAEAGFADPIAVTACSVVSVATGQTAVGLTCAPNTAPTATTGVATLTATSAAATGPYTVTFVVSDTASPALTQTTTTSVTIVNQAAPVFTPTSGSGPATFSIPTSFGTIPASALTCNSALIATSLPNGTYTTTTNVSFADIGIKCTAVAAGTGANTYTFTVIAGNNVTSAHLERHPSNGLSVALFGAPFLLLFGLLPASRKQRKALLRTMGVALIAIVTLHVTGCGTGGFTRTTTITATSGSYLIQIVDTQNNSTVAEVPLIIAN